MDKSQTGISMDNALEFKRPMKDPITGHVICDDCWNGVHHKHSRDNCWCLCSKRIRSSCDPYPD